ncbi:pyridine nucleotide-disulfide oxidoreductase [Hirsutella rhossiliensis]|uniref:Pyridine nucleotide-disulfide oxidoreductase domain-containing protein n=1 Tax=Hirsutella rhossiliensis TaxID=111463 RepID=A0A9P8MZW0_9HYPO|nr:pyridine nucleotide-disulfide oxidoreductase domain-containing protein [Hirsutella rhossiliensis]KAH0965543.1 pyridine nucleotide-disulfide oxidoreductase domain-containing protein [Hirsutella rhossiliensis]
MDMREVVIVGAGWCGLIAAKTYLQSKSDANLLVIDSASTLGGTWCKERLYPHLVAEAHYGLFEFSDLEMLNDGQNVTKSGLISGDAVHQYLNNYATEFGLHKHLRLNTQVLACEKLIVATGLTSEPFVPDIPNNGFGGEVMHSKEMGKVETTKKIRNDNIQTVAVYGGSKSAFDAVNMLLQAGKSVEWIPSFRLNNSRFLAMFSPNLFSKDTVARWLHSTGPAWLTQPLVKGFWRVISFLLMGEARYDKSENTKALKPVMGLDSLLWSPATLGVMTHPDLWKDIHEGTRVRVRQNAIQSLEANGVRLDDGTHVDADMVIYSTGWKSLAANFLFSDRDRLAAGLPSPASYEPKMQQKWEILRRQGDAQVRQRLPLLSQSPLWESHHPRIEDDFHLYRSIIPASAEENDRSLAYVGFLRTTGAPIVYEAQALWAVAYLQGKLEVPSREKRERETAALNAWARRRYLCGRKVPFAMFDFLPYVDSLYHDLGVNPRRKGNPISEIFALYKPSDFRGVVKEWIESREQEAHGPREVKSWSYPIVLLMVITLGVIGSTFLRDVVV